MTANQSILDNYIPIETYPSLALTFLKSSARKLENSSQNPLQLFVNNAYKIN